MLAAAPALLLLLFAAWSGSFAGGAGAAAAASGHLALLLAALGAGALWRDPLRLGAAGRLLPAALWITLAASAWASPTPRAGRVAVTLLPAFLLLPAAVERWWGDPHARRRGLRAVSAVVGGVAAWSLLHLALARPPRAAMPLGHHNLLAGWLVSVLPLALLPWRERGRWRWLGAGSGLLGLVALAATGSLLGCAAVALQALLALLWLRRWHRWLLPAALLVLAFQMPRLAAIVSGHDLSARARAVYLDAGWRGFRVRPWLGWGPGSVPWTIGGFTRPIPGVNPPSEVIGDLHSLPLQILYELGATGFLFTLGTAALFLRRRLREREAGEDPALLAAGLIGLLGAAATRLGAASLAVSALPVAVAVAAGAALAGKPRPAIPGGKLVPLLYAAAAALALVPLDRAHALYDLAARATDPQLAREHLETAERLDAAFPLYAARRAWLEAESASTAEAAGRALSAAEGTPGLPPLWLQAGYLGASSGEKWAAGALERGIALDPLGALAPYHRLAVAPEDPRAPRWGARALLGEPRLLAAVFWEERPALRQAAVREVESWPGVDAGWRAALAAAARDLPPDRGPVALLGLEMDATPHLALSLHAFRRRPWPARLAPVEVRRESAEALRMPAATTLETTARAAVAVASDGI